MEKGKEKEITTPVTGTSRYLILLSAIALCCICLIMVFTFNHQASAGTHIVKVRVSGITHGQVQATAWQAPGINTIPAGKQGDMIRYGRALIISTAKYLGPRGSVAHLTNGMNCQNCHLAAGTKLFSNNFAGFTASYPKYSARSGKTEPAAERIAECFERSLNGKAPSAKSKEVQAILAYMQWLGKGVKKGQEIYGASTEKLPFLTHPADPVKGKAVFLAKCRACHGQHGQGLLAADKRSFIYPPLWGAQSYNEGAGMYRLINFAGFVKNNMPFGATYQKPQLTNEEAWNVAAFVNSQPRPHRDQSMDYPGLSKKPIDMPFGPFADKFSARQHKLGPFGPIQKARKTNNIKKS